MSRKLELFEYETIYVGAEYGEPGHRFTLTSEDFNNLVRLNDFYKNKLLTVGHQRLTMSSLVGYVEVGNLAIEILPKADRNRSQATIPAWREGLLTMLAVATDLRLDVTTDSAQQTKRSSLIELVAVRFVDEVERLIRDGLAKGYRETEANRLTFCGRLDFPQHLRENAARADRFFVRFGIYDSDIVVNQVVSLALRTLEGLTLSNRTTARVKACRLALPELTSIRVEPSLFERLRLGRSTARYERALTLARMILERQAPQLRAGRTRVFALLFDMNVLWERYIAALFRRVLEPDLEVTAQDHRRFWKADGYQVRNVKPDIVVRRRADKRVVAVADTKWKVIDGGPPADGDLKQMFVYNELLDAPRALLLYPATERSSGRCGEFEQRPGSTLQKHRCETIHLGVLSGTNWSDAGLRAQIGALFVDPPSAR